VVTTCLDVVVSLNSSSFDFVFSQIYLTCWKIVSMGVADGMEAIEVVILAK
jgi:hypothetical protein